MTAYDTQLHDEAGRLRALQRYNVLDSGAEANFDLITDMVRDLLHVPICAVSLVDEERQWFKSRQGLDAWETPRTVAFCDHTIRGREVLTVDDATADERFATNPLVTGELGIRSYAGVPLTTPDGYNVGALCAIDREARIFERHELEILDRFGKLVVEQLELRTLAMIDGLTGALSRRSFVDTVRKQFCQSLKGGPTGALITFDLDHFKLINDRFGHSCGNEVLQMVGNLCKRLLRSDDRFGRLGGEEFGILLTGANLRMAKGCAERIRKALRSESNPSCGSVTASFGVAILEGAIDVDDWQQRSDLALYAAKEAGRDRTVVYDPVSHGKTAHRRRPDMSELLEDCARWRCE